VRRMASKLPRLITPPTAIAQVPAFSSIDRVSSRPPLKRQ
jgi:hypothetical protein